MAAIRPGPLLAAAGGLLLIYSGIKGKKVTSALRDVINGESPKNAADNVISGTSGTGVATDAAFVSTTTDSSVANAALKWQGHCYTFGGAPGPNAAHCWDCSSFVNYVVGIELKGAIPGYGAGKYTGTVHGPPTTAWLIWGGVRSVSRNAIQAGDLLVWQTHMGIALGGGRMISALNPSDGTEVTSISGVAPPGEVMFPKRLVR